MTEESEVLSREARSPGLPRFRWDSQEAVRYEVAVEALNRAIGASARGWMWGRPPRIRIRAA